MKRLALIAAAIVVVSCGGSNDSQVVTAPSATVVTETFTGTVNPPVVGVGQQDIHNFTVSVDGTLSVTLTAAGPPPTIKVGLGVGNPGANGTCSMSTGNFVETAAGTTAQLSGAIGMGTYCVSVFDTGNILQPVTYSVTVAHT